MSGTRVKKIRPTKNNVLNWNKNKLNRHATSEGMQKIDNYDQKKPVGEPNWATQLRVQILIIRKLVEATANMQKNWFTFVEVV